MPTAAQGEPLTTQRLAECCQALREKKAYDVAVLHVAALTPVADHYVVASGFSRRQVQTLADAVRERMGRCGYREVHCEGYTEARWVCIDYGDVVVHIFQDEVRRYFDLEGLWADAPQERLEAEPPALQA